MVDGNRSPVGGESRSQCVQKATWTSELTGLGHVPLRWTEHIQTTNLVNGQFTKLAVRYRPGSVADAASKREVKDYQRFFQMK